MFMCWMAGIYIAGSILPVPVYPIPEQAGKLAPMGHMTINAVLMREVPMITFDNQRVFQHASIFMGMTG